MVSHRNHPLRQHARILAASLVGTAVEFYDFYIYATASALVIGPLFFPAQSPAARTLLAFMTFGLAFVARPVGAIAFGHFGDKVGRKSTLVASLMLMGGSTLLIAFLPTYAMAGPLAPALLCLLRFGQGFGLGGEWGGASLLAVENAPRGWEARFGAAPQLGAPLGFLAANGLFLILTLVLPAPAFAAWGWRIPFLASSLLVGLGLWVRLKIGETAAFRAALDKAPPPRVPVGELLTRYPGAVVAGTAGVVACFAIFYLATTFALSFATTKLGYSMQAFLGVQLVANFALAVGIALAGYWADRRNPSRVLATGAALTILVGLVFGSGLASGSLLVVLLTLAVSLLVMGLAYGPLGAWLPTLYPVGVRYTGISIAFNMGGIIGGALAPFAASWLALVGGVAFVGLFLTVAGALTLCGVLLAPRQHA
ncbi:general substrate transporter [Novosphingobium nitrogenifigens DSM 19370]|uniref:General substrate transporter n=1 Tax=Novosphingobium nitrogenifigens DSM 19370 TaxID=983920 RepID=F1Z849_9SPHN|nr:MFS transporter [Novosphingobium nitrogenifigens]EGD59176.1 general substrate transporter [Novosphingobium nitrogenifigens DSM 19370]